MLLRGCDQRVEVPFVRLSVRHHHLSEVSNTSTSLRLSQAVHEGPFASGDGHTLGAAPDDDRTLDPLTRNTEESEFVPQQGD